MAQIKEVRRTVFDFGYGSASIIGAGMVLAEDSEDRYEIYIETTTGPRRLRIGRAKPQLGSWAPLGYQAGDEVIRIGVDNDDLVLWLEAERPDGSWEVIPGDSYSLTELALAPDKRSAGFKWAFQQTKLNVRAFEV